MPASAAVFASPHLSARVLRADEVPALQALYDANPEYALAINGRVPGPSQAQADFDERPPAHLGYSAQWTLGLFDKADALSGISIVTADLCVPGVWHLALLLIATRLHGQGVAMPIYLAMEDWIVRQGARWLRLGVVQGNTRAERFWQRMGYAEVRVRENIDTGGRLNTLRVMVKPLAAAGTSDLACYLASVPRDQPGSTLP